ncbi:unnamed protein product [Rotaria sp. Silwood1]|nr:unnamed protein product [Rotaria sp. Silwood1]
MMNCMLSASCVHPPLFNINKSMKSKSQMRTRESTPRLPLSSERSVYLTKLIADFIIYNYLPLSIVESP